MTAENHSDPFQDAMGAGMQRAMQVTSGAVTAAQAYAYHHRNQATASAERDERARRALLARARAEQDVARAGWAPALDPDWLSRADLYQVAQAWGQAMPYSDRNVPWYQPVAATALRRCEERLRDLHPFAMARYDRLRSEGFWAAEAMRMAAPLFASAPRARDGHYTPRLALEPGTGENVIRAAAVSATPGPDEFLDLPGALERRGMQIVAALQERARAQGRPPLGEAEQRTVLETVTNLPPDVIDRVVQPGHANTTLPGSGYRPVPRSALPEAGAPAAGRAARPWEHDFPVPIQTVVATAAEPAQSTATATQGRRQRRSPDGRPQARPAPRHRKPR
jgi:hypothetical protein